VYNLQTQKILLEHVSTEANVTLLLYEVASCFDGSVLFLVQCSVSDVPVSVSLICKNVNSFFFSFFLSCVSFSISISICCLRQKTLLSFQQVRSFPQLHRITHFRLIFVAFKRCFCSKINFLFSFSFLVLKRRLEEQSYKVLLLWPLLTYICHVMSQIYSRTFHRIWNLG
jgi:hypothetical protein